MSKMPYIAVDKPSRSNVDLSRINRFSCAPGLLYPVQTTDVYPGDDISIDVSALVKTLPLLGPLMGSFKVQLDHFFIPNRLYCRSLHNDKPDFDPSTIHFPFITLNQLGTDGPIGSSRGVHPSSLHHFLGVPEYFGRMSDGTTGLLTRNFNAIPFLGYFDIFRSYYANTQEPNFYNLTWKGGTTDIQVQMNSMSLDIISSTRDSLLAHDDSTPFSIGQNWPEPFNPENAHYPLGGLVCRTYMPDRFNSWVNSANYDSIKTKSSVLVVDGKFSMDALRLSNKMNEMLLKTQVSGGRYSDWQQVQYGASMRPVVEVPSFIGSVSTELTFDDVIQTSASEPENPLGSLGGRGAAYLKNRKSRYYVPESGFVMTIMSLVPRVDYYQGVKHYLRYKTMSDLHVPTMDGIGFQDLLTDDFAAFSTVASGNPIYTSVGKQPAWTELMTATNEIHGDFAEPNKLMYMTLARRYIPGAKNVVSNSTTYIDPTLYNQNFADASLTAQNFWVQLRFEIYAHRAISKRVMPNL